MANQKQSGKTLRPHPRNAPNRAAEARLKQLNEQMQAEVIAWESEKQDLDEYEQQTVQLQALVEKGEREMLEKIMRDERERQARLLKVSDETEVESEEESKLRKEAKEALEWANSLAEGTLAPAHPKAPAAAGRKSKGKGKATAVDSEMLSGAMLGPLGTEHDVRWKDVEFNVSSDHFHSRNVPLD